MKKGLILAFVGMMQIAMADVPTVIDHPETYDLIFHSLVVDTSQMSDDFCDTVKSKWTKSWNWCEAYTGYIAYNSPADETVFFELMMDDDSSLTFFLRREEQRCSSGVAVGTLGILPFSEVLSTELFRMQSFGIIKNSPDSLSSLLKNSTEKMKTVGGCEDIDLVFYEEGFEAFSILGNNNSCCSLVESSESLPRISPVSPGVRATKVSPGKFRLVGVPLGTEISVFNLKGQTLLRKNFDGGLLEIPNVPAVAKVGGDWVKFE